MDNTVHGILQARILEWVAYAFFRGSSQPREWTQVSCIAGRFFTSWDTRKTQEYWHGLPWSPPGDLPNSGIKPRSPALQADSLPAEPQGKPRNTGVGSLSLLQGIFPTQESNRGLLHCGFFINWEVFHWKKIKSDTVSIVSPSISHEVMGPDAGIFVFWMLSFKPAFSLSSFTFNRKLFSSSSLSAYPLQYSWASLVAQLVKNPPAMQETWVQSLGWEDPLEKGKATNSSILAWRFPWTI